MTTYSIVDEGYEVEICNKSKDLFMKCMPSDNGFYIEVVSSEIKGRIEVLNQDHFNKLIRGASRFYTYQSEFGDWEYKVTKHN